MGTESANGSIHFIRSCASTHMAHRASLILTRHTPHTPSIRSFVRPSNLYQSLYINLSSLHMTIPYAIWINMTPYTITNQPTNQTHIHWRRHSESSVSPFLYLHYQWLVIAITSSLLLPPMIACSHYYTNALRCTSHQTHDTIALQVNSTWFLHFLLHSRSSSTKPKQPNICSSFHHLKSARSMKIL